MEDKKINTSEKQKSNSLFLCPVEVRSPEPKEELSSPRQGIFTCANCGKEFKLYRNKKNHKCCCSKCYYNYYNKTHKKSRKAYDNYHYKTHKEFHKAYAKMRRKLNPNYKKQWNENHPDYNKQWYLKHPKYNLLQCRKWRIKNKERSQMLKKRYKARKKGGGELPLERIQRVYEDNIKKFGTLTCYLCFIKIKFKDDSLDHKIPLYRGGDNTYENLGVAHFRCNCRKGIKTEAEYREDLKKWKKIKNYKKKSQLKYR